MTAKKSNRFTQVGLDRLIRLNWLNRTAALTVDSSNESAIKASLRDEIGYAFPSSDPSVRGSLDKTITILMKTWLRVPVGLESLRDRGLELFGMLPENQRIVLHWGMIMAAYPFWAEVAGQVGRLFQIQGNAIASQVQRRAQEKYGQRETVTRRVRYVVRSFIDWQVVTQSDSAGIYKAGTHMIIDNRKLASWLIEAALNSIPTGTGTFESLINSPSLFPFTLKCDGAQTLCSGLSSRVECHNGSSDQILVLQDINE